MLGPHKLEQKVELALFVRTLKPGRNPASELSEEEMSALDPKVPLVRWTWRCATWDVMTQRGAFGT